jgi:hypothetical protein
MKIRIAVGLISLLFITPAAFALDKGLEIAAARKMAGGEIKTKAAEAGSPIARKTDLVYTITVMNNSLKDMPAMEMKYVIFLEREKLGDKNSGLQRIKGNAPINALKSRQKQAIETQDFTLSAEKLAPGWSYVGGGKTNTRESVKGIWVRIYRDGELVNELISPSTLSAKEAWKD